MKLEAGRATDVDDVATLIGRLGIATAEDALAIHGRLFPDSTRRGRAEQILNALLGQRGTGRTVR